MVAKHGEEDPTMLKVEEKKLGRREKKKNTNYEN